MSALTAGLICVLISGLAPYATVAEIPTKSTSTSNASTSPLNDAQWGTGTRPKSASPSSTTVTPKAKPKSVTINYSGDLLWHNTLWYSAKADGKGAKMDFYPQLAHLTKYVSQADFAICHSEVPFAPAGGPYKS